MNGHDDDWDYAPMPEDDDEMYVAMTYHEWLAGWLAAHSIDLAAGGPDAGDVADERDEPSDEFMFDRAMSIGRGVLR